MESRASLERPMLVNLASDPTESQDLSQQYPENAKVLEEAWKKWNAEMAAPGQASKVN
jgi:hypothetical protein